MLLLQEYKNDNMLFLSRTKQNLSTDLSEINDYLSIFCTLKKGKY